jgi:hypothetical protein
MWLATILQASSWPKWSWGPEEGNMAPPPFAVVDVTLDDRYSGGALADLDRQGGAAELKRGVIRHPLNFDSQ